MPREPLRTRFFAGVAVLVPLAVSAWVLLALVRFLGSTLAPVGTALRGYGFESDVIVVVLQAASLGILVVLILAIGTITRRQIGRRIVDRVDDFLVRIPGLGSVYQTARRMSDLVLDPEDDGAQFREVKLVEFPGQDTYTLGFLTSESPPDGVVSSARAITGDPDAAYRTLFLPMAPNPVMGGHLTHVPAEQVHDVDLDVEEAVQYILTTGIVDSSADL